MMDARNAALTKTSAGLGNVFIEGVLSGNIKAYSTTEDRMWNALDKDAFKALLLTDKGNPNSGLSPAQITKFQVKEDWMYLEGEHRLVGRIIAIAPLKEVIGKDGVMTEEPIFWLYYPEVRKYLREQLINGSPDVSVQNLDQWFEMHQYSGKINKVSAPGLRPR
jgi:hypothetical protein